MTREYVDKERVLDILRTVPGCGYAMAKIRDMESFSVEARNEESLDIYRETAAINETFYNLCKMEDEIKEENP